MKNVNRVILTGNLTRDPELRHTQGGLAVCTLGIAVNGSEKVGDSWQERADFFDVTVFGDRGQACADHLSKGRPVAVDGRLRLERWETESGEKRSKVKVVADNVEFLPHGQRDETPFEPAAASGPSFGDDPY